MKMQLVTHNIAEIGLNSKYFYYNYKKTFRMSFFGVGTDMPAFFNEHGCAVISTTIDKFCYENVRYMPPFHPYNSELVHNRFERVNDL